ncbi:MAG: tetratricopeptide repeat protein [Cytophagaceae bacterium]|jgi:tetratricopeptide (TPR) repeat protein|nr:tetratricopeptide repeat protein [Cytophagaceae bacterium]
MKRTLLFFIVIFAATSLFGQRGKVASASYKIDQGDLEGAKKDLELALVHEKSKDWARTYVVAARLAAAEFKTAPNNIDKILQAAEYFQKAIERDNVGDEKGKGIGRTANEIKMAIMLFMPELQNVGVEAFNAEDFPLATKAFEKVSILSNDPLLQPAEQKGIMQDSIFTYYTALAAFRSENWEKAIEYFKKSIDVHYGEGDAILLLNDTYAAVNDTVNMIANLQKGSEVYPQDDRIIINLINLYLKTGQYEDALRYLDTAITKDPQNATFYFARGFLHENRKKFDEAEVEYKKAIELQGDYYEPLISLGVIYFNRGADKTQEIQDPKISAADYEAGIAQSNEFFKQALPYVERAEKVKPNEEVVLESLKSLYYRLQMMDKYDEVNRKLESLKQ